jgi:tetratricopeptide (TPR) repeat protein
LGKIFKRLSRTDQAERVYRSCMEKYPSVLNAYSELGELLLEQKKFQDAMELFSRSLELNRGGDIKAYFGLANALLANGQIQNAVKVLEEGGRHFPGQLAGDLINPIAKRCANEEAP